MKTTNFTCRLVSNRINKNSRSSQLYYYEIRHRSGLGAPLTIEPMVKVDFWCTLISNIDLSLLFIRKDFFNISLTMRSFIYNNVDGNEFDGKELFKKIVI